MSHFAGWLATPGGLEPPTFSLEGCCSIQLSYGAPSDTKAQRPSMLINASKETDDRSESCRNRISGAFFVRARRRFRSRFRSVRHRRPPHLCCRMQAGSAASCPLPTCNPSEAPPTEAPLDRTPEAIGRSCPGLTAWPPSTAERSAQPSATQPHRRPVGRGSRIRTCDPLLPKQVRYQTAPCPEPPSWALGLGIFRRQGKRARCHLVAGEADRGSFCRFLSARQIDRIACR